MTKRTRKKLSKWKNRIVGHDDVPPQEITRHDKNWRVHPPEQRQALLAVLRKVGWVQEVIINRRTRKLIDGHLRVEEALKRKEKTVPVIYVDLSPQEEEEILVTLDPIAGMAGEREEVLNSLLESTEESLSEVHRLVWDWEEKAEEALEEVGEVETRSEKDQPPDEGTELSETEKEEHQVYSASDELPGTKELKDDVLFKSDLILGIPSLQEGMLMECPEPIIIWTAPDSSEESPYYITSMGNGNCRGLPWDRTILCFYVPDFYFEVCWAKKASFTKRLLNRGYMGVIGPDFSISPAHPLAVRIWQTYRQRFISRYWQEAGIEVIPTVPLLSVEGDQEFLYAGIPRGAPCIALQVQSPPAYLEEGGSRGIEWDELIQRFRWALSFAVKELSPQSLLVYGGPKRNEIIEAASLPKQLHVISVENFATSRGRWLQKEREATV